MAVDARYSIANDILNNLSILQYKNSSCNKPSINIIKSYINSLGCIDTDTELLVISEYCGNFICLQDAEYATSHLTLVNINIEY